MHWYWQRMQVRFPECGLEFAAESLLVHIHSHHNVFRGDQGGHPPPPREAQTYRVFFLIIMLQLRCLAEGCLGGASNRTNIRVRFVNRHVWDIIVILEEGNQPYPRFPKCDIFFPQRSLNVRNPSTYLCRRGEEHYCFQLAEEEARVGVENAISTYRIPLDPVSSLK